MQYNARTLICGLKQTDCCFANLLVKLRHDGTIDILSMYPGLFVVETYLCYA
jgi:hypothetical protein